MKESLQKPVYPRPAFHLFSLHLYVFVIRVTVRAKSEIKFGYWMPLIHSPSFRCKVCCSLSTRSGISIWKHFASHWHCCVSRMASHWLTFFYLLFRQTVISSKFYHECPWNIDCIISMVFPPWTYVVQFNKERRAGIFTTRIKYWGSLSSEFLSFNTPQCTGAPTSSLHYPVENGVHRTAPKLLIFWLLLLLCSK